MKRDPYEGLPAAGVAEADVLDGPAPALASFSTPGHTIARATLVPVYGA
jgi:hypothetical protein